MKAKMLVYALLALNLAAIHLAEAQESKKAPRIGYLAAAPLSAITNRIDEFRMGLRDLGYVEGKNIVVEWRSRSPEGTRDRMPALAAELMQLKVEVIVRLARERLVPPKKQLLRYLKS